MPSEESKENIIQLDDDFDIVRDILDKKSKEKKPTTKIEKILHFFNTHKKLSVILALLLGVLIVAFIFIMGSLFSKEEAMPSQEEEAIVSPPQFSIEGGGEIIVDEGELEDLIGKANFLYMNGNKEEALDLYGRIASYSEGLSSYNLGVVQMQQEAYKGALKSFQTAIDVGEYRVISALNAAVSSLYLKEPLQYQYYLQLAQTYLPYAANLPIHSYLYGLIHYYQGNYIEAISPLTHQNTPYYKQQNNRLLAALYSYFNSNRKAIAYLDNDSLESKEWFNLALLYARIGEYQQADKFLAQIIDESGNTLEVDMASALVKLKLARFNQAVSFLKPYADNQEMINKNPYPIKVILRDDFFDVNIAQKRFWNEFGGSKLNAYEILFYYAPYKVFDAKEALYVIQEGGINISIENLQEAKEVLLRGQTISKVNRNIASAILEILSGDIRIANDILQSAVAQYPNHAILHYNLGLNYAQMGDYDKSYQHFIRSFHLNPKDVQVGVFALATAKLTHRDFSRLESDVGKEVVNFQGSKEEMQFLQVLLNFVRDGSPASLGFLEQSSSNILIYYALNFVQGVLLGDQSLLINSSHHLKNLQPTDPLSNLLELLALNYYDDPKTLSLKLQSYYQDKNLNKDLIYYGPSIVRETYIKVGHIVGTLHYVQQDLDYRLISERKDVRGVTQALALTYIYLQEFEKAFTLYNNLIDDLKENDTQTLFLAAVAAIGAGHTENAAALLQLSKLEAPTNYETRVANGLLYLQEKNFNAANSQFTVIGDSEQKSDYFDFKIDTSHLLRRINMD
ncbi:tetratricopeptide repeat protein [Helicobacter apodemus]|uniref:Tetratricopeptide repeat protein n=1 Tax=Helicobacter apodemus TaxID=135569 RepID=A0A4U8UKN9_9HELI|nr:tetratricopeptide repeat protein [Helicobacter apodemus]TLE17250.1 tetratricopeptide repeat protein [Helicobacter apodemus]